MKNKRFMGLLALASCVTLLTGCNSNAMFGLGAKWNQFVDWGKGLLGLKQEEQKKSDEEPAPEEPSRPDVKIELMDLPEEARPGSVLDLDDYVTIYGTTEDFSIELSDSSKDLASVEGHKVTILAEGELSFTITVGGQSKEVSLSTIYPEKKAFIAWSENLKDNYIGYHFEADEDTETWGFANGIIAHGAKYSYNEHFDEDDSKNPITGGYYEDPNGDVYTYKMEEVQGSGSEKEYAPHFMFVGDEPASIKDIAGPFNIDYRLLECSTDEDEIWFGGDYTLFFPADAAGKNEAAVDAILQIPYKFDDIGYEYFGTRIEEIHFSVTDDQQNVTEKVGFVMIPLITYQGTHYYWGDFVTVIVQESDHTVAFMDAIVDELYIPESLPLKPFTDAVDEFVTEESFILSTEYGVYKKNGTKYTAQQASALFNEGTIGASFCEAIGTVNGFVTPTQIHVEEVGLEKYSYGLVLKDSKAYTYEYVEAEQEQAQGGFVASATPNTSFAQFDPEDNYTFLNSATTFIDAETGTQFGLYDTIFVNEVVESAVTVSGHPNAKLHKASFSGASAFSLLSYLMYYSVPELGETERNGLGDIFYMMYYYYYVGYVNFFAEMDVSMSYVADDDGVISASIDGSVVLNSANDSWQFHTTFAKGATIPTAAQTIVFPEAA